MNETTSDNHNLNRGLWPVGVQLGVFADNVGGDMKQEQIDSMISALHFLKTKRNFKHFNQYFESNIEAIDCQIAVLEHKLTENDCWNQWPTHHQEQDQYNREKALEAVKWLWEEGEDLVELWQKERTTK